MRAFLLSCLALSMSTAIASEFKVEIGQKSQFATEGTITLKGGVKSEKPPVFVDDSDTMKKILNGEIDDTIVLSGGVKKEQKSKPSLTTPKQEWKYGKFAKEIPIPTNFDLLDEARKQPIVAMPNSAPQGLGVTIDVGIIDDSDLQKTVRGLNQKYQTQTRDIQVGQAKAVAEKIKEIALNYVEQRWLSKLKKEAELMMLSGLPMKITFIPTQDHFMYKFMLNDVVKGKVNLLQNKKMRSGIFSVLGNPYINDRYVPICYIIFDEQVEQYEEKILNPLSKKLNEEAVASFVVGQSVGHCLDVLERQTRLHKTNTWFANQVNRIGLYEPVFRALFPRGMRPSIFALKEAEIRSYNAQQQYENALADSFGVMWAYNRGYKGIYSVYRELVSQWKPESIYNTAYALKHIEERLYRMKTNTLKLSQVWKIARENQVINNVSLINSPQLAQFEQLDRKQVFDKEVKSVAKKVVKTLEQMPTSTSTNKMDNLPRKVKARAATSKEIQEMSSMKNNELSDLQFDVTARIKKDLVVQEPKMLVEDKRTPRKPLNK